MIFFMITVVPLKIDCTRLSIQGRLAHALAVAMAAVQLNWAA
jgi:hypothetical protein